MRAVKCLLTGLFARPFQGDEELAIDVMDRLSASVLESFIYLTGADQVWIGFLPLK